MKKFKVKLWFFLAFIGLIGVASMLFSDIPMDNVPKEVFEKISPEDLKILVLINPSIILLLLISVGVALYDKLGFSLPLIEPLLGKESNLKINFLDILKSGVALGIVAGIFIVIVFKSFQPFLPLTLTDTSSQNNLNIITKLLYGGVTEELMMRFGLMTLITWIIFKISKKLNDTTFWIGILIASIVFALGHLPIVFQMVGTLDLPVYAYIILGNSLGGLIFGYLYWKKGLESAIIAHAFTHLTMISIHFVADKF
jgi:membrane protease YdiL (CAAX protease family)